MHSCTDDRMEAEATMVVLTVLSGNGPGTFTPTSKGSSGNSIPHLDMPPRRSSGGTIHGSVRPRTTVPIRRRLAHAPSLCRRQDPVEIAYSKG